LKEIDICKKNKKKPYTNVLCFFDDSIRWF
jgi:hypothetical protein